MARIKCKTPSTGRTVNLTLVNIGTDWETLVEAPDFSVPDTSNLYPARDPLDSSRAIRVGEVFFITPIYVRNKSTITCWVEVQLILEDGTAVQCPGRMYIPANDTCMVPVQGRSVMKRNPMVGLGDRLQIRAQAESSLDAWASAEEKPASEHIGVV